MTKLDPDVVMLTALDLEYQAVRDHLTQLTAMPPVAGTRFEIGRVRGHDTRVALAVMGKGNHGAAILTERAIAEFAPKAVLCVGVAGALDERISRGDVVVATEVYAYHGGTSEDHQFGARPRVWPARHELEQAARHVYRSGIWTESLPKADPLPKVRFAPIAAGEVVIQSRTAETANLLRLHYNDAAAGEMEGAGVAMAGHLNNTPTMVIRGISDMADSNKRVSDRSGWQPRAAANAAAFAIALAVEHTEGLPTLSTRARPRDTIRPTDASLNRRDQEATPLFVNNNSRIDNQIGYVQGDVNLAVPTAAKDITKQLADLRADLDRALNAGRIDRESFREAQKELDTAQSSAKEDTPVQRRNLLFAMKRLRGIVGDMSELGTAIATIIALAGGMQ